MKRIINIIIVALAAAVCLAAIVISVVGQKARRSVQYCRGIRIEVADSAKNKFVDSCGIGDRIDRNYGGYVHRPVDAINLDELEKCIMEEPFVRKCVAYMTSDGLLDITVTQCTPVVKVINGNALWYIDDRGDSFRMTKDWCNDIPEISGPAPLENKAWKKAVAATFIHFSCNMRLYRNIASVECDEKGELTFYLADKEEAFIFGYPEGSVEKIQRIIEYLDKVACMSDKEYQSVNIKYSGQIVCR